MMRSVLALLSLLLFAQQRDAPAPAAAPAGTGEIAGVVVSVDANPQPLRRAVVTITGGANVSRSVLSDDAGRFSFIRLAAGTYSVTARKAAYLAAPYGAKRPGRSGVPIAIADGQRTSVTISMFRGAAITGMLRDPAGQPVGDVAVRVIDARTLLTLSSFSSPELATADDRGVYRIYGLLPGDYFVVALPSPGGSGEIVAASTSSVDSALASLAARQTAPAPATVPSPTPQRPIGFAPIYYPGTPNYADAVRVHVDAGEEREDINFEVRALGMAAINGIVSGDVPNLAAVQVSIIPSGPRVTTEMSSNSLSGQAIDAQGRFRYANLPPGSYRLVARARTEDTAPASVSPNPTVAGMGRVGGGEKESLRPPATGDFLYGVADVELRGEDLTGVSLSLQPGGTISGRIIFNGSGVAAVPSDLTKVRPLLTLQGFMGMVSANGLIMGTGLISSPASTVKPDGTFEIKGIGPGRFSLNTLFATPADGRGWKVRSALAGDRDLLDGVIDLGPGIDLRNVVITFSDARTEISGTLQLGTGAPATEYYIVALPTDRTLWRQPSRRILSVRPATDGRFVFGDLPAGEYFITALTDLDPIDLTNSTFLEQLVPAGVKVTVAEGEKKVQNLQIR